MSASRESETDAVPLARVVLADDHPAVLELVAAALAGACVVVGVVSNGRELLTAVDQLDPDAVVLDIGMPEVNGIDAAREIQCAHPEIKFVFLTVQEDADYARAAFAAGGLGYVVKSRLASDLLPAVRAALTGRRFLSPCVKLENAT